MSNTDETPPLVPDRRCGECTMCCKVFPIPETGKADYENCPHLVPGVGCGIYETRPQTCRDFFCMWRFDASLDEAWKPSNAGFVLHDPPPWALIASHDVDAPDAWRREPYQSQIREWALELGRGQHLVGVRAGDRTTLLVRNGEVELKPPARPEGGGWK
jgi:hypothetical protein